jgi:hypothetical protein
MPSLLRSLRFFRSSGLIQKYQMELLQRPHREIADYLDWLQLLTNPPTLAFLSTLLPQLFAMHKNLM